MMAEGGRIGKDGECQVSPAACVALQRLTHRTLKTLRSRRAFPLNSWKGYLHTAGSWMEPPLLEDLPFYKTKVK